MGLSVSGLGIRDWARPSDPGLGSGAEVEVEGEGLKVKGSGLGFRPAHQNPALGLGFKGLSLGFKGLSLGFEL